MASSTPNSPQSHTVSSSERPSEEAVRNAVMAGSSDMAERMRALDWSKTPLGPVSNWPQSLKTAVRIMLASRFAMFAWWGRELISLYNDPYRAFLGIKHPAALGKSAREVWAEIWDQIGPRTDAVLLRGESTFDEALLLLMARHGYVEETYFTFSYSPLPDDAGNPGGIFCAVTEATEQVIGERRLRALSEIAGATASAHSAEEVCEAAARCLEHARRDLPFSMMYLLEPDGHTLRRICTCGIDASHPAAPESVNFDDANAAWPVASVIEHGKTVVLDDLAQRFEELPNGEWDVPPSAAVLIPIAQQGGVRPAGVFVAGLNPHRKFGYDFRDFVSLLVNHVASAIANAVAYETERKRAEALAELDRAKSAFFSNISHEFRTPLTLMLGPLEEVLVKVSEAKISGTRDLVEVAHRNGTRLLKLVNTLLDFSRIEAGRMSAAYQPTDLALFTRELASAFHSATDRANLELRIECEPLREPLFVDRDMWEKIVLNLVSNAFKFTFDGTITVCLAERDGAAELTVSDTGVGIPEEELPKVFERFHRVEGARGRSFEGSGIGLALVQELVKLHGGTISLESAVGKGTTCRVSLPFGAGHLPQKAIFAGAEDPAPGTAAVPYVAEALSWLTPRPAPEFPHEFIDSIPVVAAETETARRVLVVDDNCDMRDYVQRLLSGRFLVIGAENGKIALELARKSPPDLVLADVMMPQMDGFELLAALRTDPTTCTIPIILLSARAGDEARIEGLRQGADDYLVKPFTARELLARVETHLALADVRNQAIAAARESEERLQAIIETTPECVKILSSDGTIAYMNPPGLAMIGAVSAEHVIGKSIYDCIAPEDRERYVAFNERVCRGGRGSLEFDIVGLKGIRRHMETHAVPLRNPDGTLAHLAVTRDMTERKRTEEVLRRTEKLAVTGRMAATIAHEINNPLEAVTNLLYLLRSFISNEEGHRFLALAETELARVSHITKQTLAFHRGGTKPEPVNLSEVIDTVISVFGKRLSDKGIRLEREEQRCVITALKGELCQLFSNLVANAIEAAPEHGRIRVSITSAGEACRISVSDNGRGIPEENRARLFEPFFTTKTVGTGLGLWVAQEIAVRHGGRISVESSTAPESHGTSFTVLLTGIGGESAVTRTSAA